MLGAIRHQETDIVPYQVDFTGAALARLAEYVGDPEYAWRVGNHLTGSGYGYFNEVRPNYWQDEYGVVWNRTVDKDIGVVDGKVLPEPELGDFRTPEIDEKALRSNIERMFGHGSDCATLFAISFSMFERAWTLRGMEDLLIDMVTAPEFVEELLDTICEYNLKLIDIALDYPFDIIHFGDDWGQQKGLIMGPDHWRKFVKPRVARMYERARSKGRFVSQHSCGDIHELFPDLIDIGLNVYQTFQPEIYDVTAVKREFGGDLTFWGGISQQADNRFRLLCTLHFPLRTHPAYPFNPVITTPCTK